MNANPVTYFQTTEPSLTLAGTCGYSIENDVITITIAEIANNRDFDDISGTLSVELWALPQAYSGGDFTGTVLAGLSIGELNGQHYWANCHYSMAFQEPGDGTWYLALMLREWTELGYITRDYINFSVPYLVDRKPTISRSEDSNVINVTFVDNKKPAPSIVSKKTGSAVAKKTNAKKVVAKAMPRVSLNQASVEDILAVKGVSKKVAETIVAERPFASVDDILKVKGVGAKLLEKIRQFLTV